MSSKKIFLIICLILVISALSAYAGYSFMKAPAEHYYLYDPGEYFVTNIKDSRSLLKSDIIIKLNDKAQFNYFTENSFIIRDEIISLLNSKSIDELRGSDSKDVLKKEIRDRLNEVFNCDNVVETYFNDYVIQ